MLALWFSPLFQTEPTAYVSSEEYLHSEREIEFKHEYIAGKIVAMVSAEYAHSPICAKLTGELYTKLRGKGCSVVGSNIILRRQVGQ